jgi:membrane protease YdiL (CAAX protease family)
MSDRVRRTVPPPSAGARTDNPALRPLLVFAAIALPAGWLLLSVPLLLDQPQEPFVLATVLLGLILPALVLTARESGRAGVGALLRDVVRLPRPRWWLPVALLALPVLVWAAAAALGGARALTGALLADVAVDLVTGLVIINLWEEMAWTGFVQRRAMARWGPVPGSLVVAALFAGIHLPLAFEGAGGARDVLVGVATLLGAAVGLRLLIARLDVWSGRSLLSIGLLHAAFNATADLVDPAFDWVRLVATVLLGVAAIVAPSRRTGSAAQAQEPRDALSG